MNEFFKDIPVVKYEGRESRNPLSFKHYNPDETIAGKKMRDHLRFSLAYWHTMNAGGADPFGRATAIRPWLSITDPMEQAKAKMRALFEIAEKLQIDRFCFHDRDIAPETESLKENNRNLDEVVKLTAELQKSTNIRLLWGTACLFAHPRYVHGAATSPNAEVFAYAAAQVKKAMEVTHELGGEDYVFWGGREGYETLLNTDMGLELDNMARFLSMARDYRREIHFEGQLLIEPKPMEPTKHQYDFDAAACNGFLRKYGLEKDLKLNIEMNHATLAGHTFAHELHFARVNGILGSVDANQGDYLLGWDTDQMPTDIYETVLASYEILKNGGLHKGGLNFDAKVRRGSFEPSDLFYGHIAAMDTWALGFKIANKLLESGEIESFVKERYSSWQSGVGKDIVSGKVGFKELETYALSHDQIRNGSGRQEMLEGIVNRYLANA